MGSMVNCGFSQNFIIHREPFGYFAGPCRFKQYWVDIVGHNLSTPQLFVVLDVIIMMLFTP
jgi:hypothetical protein